METQRLKNIIILILALLNLFLLALLLNFRWQQSTSQQNLTRQLYTLYEANALPLAPAEALSLELTPPPNLSLHRDLSMESELAVWLLDEDVAPEHKGGGIYTYTGKKGTVTVRSNGSFDFSPIALEAEPTAFTAAFCERFGYVQTEQSLSNDFYRFSAVRSVEGIPVYNCSVSFLFLRGTLVSLSGFCLSTLNSTAAEGEAFGAADALVKFLDYRRSGSAICGEVTGVERAYSYQLTGHSPSLAAVWQISTDTHRYYVDCLTGEISRG